MELLIIINNSITIITKLLQLFSQQNLMLMTAKRCLIRELTVCPALHVVLVGPASPASLTGRYAHHFPFHRWENWGIETLEAHSDRRMESGGRWGLHAREAALLALLGCP